jgi:hypothetical protein
MTVAHTEDGGSEEPATDNLLTDPWGDGEELETYEAGESDPSFWDVATGEEESPLDDHDPVQDPEQTGEDLLVNEYNWDREDAEEAIDGTDPTDPNNYEPPEWEAPNFNLDLPEVPGWAPYAAAGVGLLLLLVVLRPYASMGATAAEVAG